MKININDYKYENKHDLADLLAKNEIELAKNKKNLIAISISALLLGAITIATGGLSLPMTIILSTLTFVNVLPIVFGGAKRARINQINACIKNVLEERNANAKPFNVEKNIIEQQETPHSFVASNDNTKEI